MLVEDEEKIKAARRVKDRIIDAYTTMLANMVTRQANSMAKHQELVDMEDVSDEMKEKLESLAFELGIIASTSP